MATQSLPALVDAQRASLGSCELFTYRLSVDQLYSAPKSHEDRPKSLDEVDPEILRTYEKLTIPLAEQQRLAGVVDAVFDSVSVATTFKDKLKEAGVIFCPFSKLLRLILS